MNGSGSWMITAAWLPQLAKYSQVVGLVCITLVWFVG